MEQVMKVIVLDEIVKQLNNVESSSLYGVKDRDTTIVSSLEKKEHLVNVGEFNRLNTKAESERKQNNLLFSMNSERLDCFYISNDGTIEDVEIEIVNYSSDFVKRTEGIIDNSVLQNKAVVIVGIGSGGATISEDLLRSGVANQILIDPDVVSLSNLCRSVYDLTDVGKTKTDALTRKLLRINPCANITAYTEDILKMDSKKLKAILKKPDLIIDGTDNVMTKRLINGLAYHKKIVLYPSVYDQGKGGDILFTVPEETPCWECVFESIYNQMKDVKKSAWNYSTGETKPMSGLISDIKVISSRTVKLALAFLTVDQDNSLLEKVTEPNCSMLFIGNESGFSFFDKPFQEVWAETEINPDCFCHTLS
jgi:molybdopterin/thiamine biosynthesis adenylyltransferase